MEVAVSNTDRGAPPGSFNMHSAGPSSSFGVYYHPHLHHHHHHHEEGAGEGSDGGGGEVTNYASGSPLMSNPIAARIHVPAATRLSPAHPFPIHANPNSSPPSYLPDGAGQAPLQHQLAVSQQSPGMGLWVGMPRSEPFKRKRGRPRKYAIDANSAALGLASFSSSMSSPQEKKRRASGKKAQINALGAAGQGFTPHVITIAAGEDMLMKITSFVQHGSWGMCILSANGAISNVTLCQPATSGGTVTYEGRYEILSLSGSFPPAENGSPHSRTGKLSISLAGPDGRVIGGGVVGLLIAASPVQVVVGTFLSQSQKSHIQAGNVNAICDSHSAGIATGATLFVSLPQSMQAEGASIQDHSSGHASGYAAQNHHASHMVPPPSMDWGGSQYAVESRENTDAMPSPDLKT